MNTENLWLELYKMQGCGTLKVEELAYLLGQLLEKVERLEERVRELESKDDPESAYKPYWESSSSLDC